MAKRILWAIICLVSTLTGYAAHLTATLQSGDKLTPFYGTNAFVDAYNAAVDGDVITLSPGSFNSTTIGKSITVVGSYAFSDDTSKSTFLTNLTISSDNVTIEGVRCTSTMTIKGADNLTINRSYIGTLTDTENGDKKYHNNTILTDCMIASNYAAMSLSMNTVLRNCSINYFSDINLSTSPALIENCNITTFAYATSSSTSYLYSQPYAIYRNCLLGLYRKYSSTTATTLNLYSPSEFHNVVFFSNFYHASGNSYNVAWKINYNSCIRKSAIIGGSRFSVSDLPSSYRYQSFDNQTVGPIDHKSYPATPNISSSTIDSETDADGNLHVKISAEARD